MPGIPFYGTKTTVRGRRAVARIETIYLSTVALVIAYLASVGCATQTNPKPRGNLCAEVELHDRSFVPLTFAVRILDDGAVGVEDRGLASPVKRIKGLDGQRLCNMLLSLDSPESRCPVLRPGEFDLRPEGAPLLVVSAPGRETIAVDVMRTLWSGEYGLAEGDFGIAMKQVEQILRHHFRRWACVDRRCRWTALSMAVPWPDPAAEPTGDPQ